MKSIKYLSFALCLLANAFAHADSLDQWTAEPSGVTNNLNAITYAPPYFVALGNDGVILTSTNGTNWTSQNSGATNNLNAVAYGEGAFVALGEGPLRFSTDATNWSLHTGLLNTAYAVTYGNGLFVAVGETGSISTSANGTNWTLRTSGYGGALRGVTFAKGLFVAVGGPEETMVMVSSDGTNWTSVSPGTNISGLSAVTCGNGTFVAVGGNSPTGGADSKIVSINATNWTPEEPAVDQNFQGVTWANGYFVAVGGSGAFKLSSTNQIIETSTDGLEWAIRVRGTNTALGAVAYGNGHFVAVGNRGQILASAPIISLAGRQSGGNTFEVDLTGEIGRSYRIQTSTNLAGTNWTDLMMVTNTAETNVYLDDLDPTMPAKFYRAVSP